MIIVCCKFLSLKGKFLISSHPEKSFPDENTPIPSASMTRNPLKKGFW
jgi:hypothetical protein